MALSETLYRSIFLRSLAVGLSIISLVVSSLAYSETRRQADAAERALTAPDENKAYVQVLKSVQLACDLVDISDGRRYHTTQWNDRNLVVIKFDKNIKGEPESVISEDRLRSWRHQMHDAAMELTFWATNEEAELVDKIVGDLVGLVSAAANPAGLEPARYMLGKAFCISQLNYLRKWKREGGRLEARPRLLQMEVWECEKFVLEPEGCSLITFN